MNKQFVLKRSVIAVALALTAPSVVFAQTDAAPQQVVQKVLVTGSNIKRGIDEQTASPVQVLGRDEIKAIGASTVKDVVDTLTSNTGALTDLGSGNSFASGATGLALRNLGKNSTLVLLNFRRVSNFGTADGGQETFVNIDSIPADVIDHVEILLDGASAIYGSDAVAGVVNIITKKEFNGVTLRAGARQSLAKHQLNRDQTASITGGVGDFNADGWNAFAHLELYHRNPYDDRSIVPQVPEWYTTYVSPTFGVRSTYSTPGNYFGRYPKNYADPTLAGKSFSTPAPGCAPENLEGGLCRFDQWARVGIHAAADRANFMTSGRLKINNDTTAFAEVTLSDTKTTFYNAPAIMQYTGTPITWYNAGAQRQESFTEPMLPVGHPYNPYSFPVQLRYRYADDMEMYKSKAHARQYRVMAGLEGNSMGWDWNTAIGTMASRSDTNQRGSKSAAGYLDAVLSGDYKFGQKNDPALLLKMFPYFGFLGESKQSFVDFRASHELMQLPGGAMSLAVGGEYRRDSFESWVTDNIAKAEIVGYGSINVTGSRNIYAAYAELAAPVIKDLELSGAVRFDKVGKTDANFVPKFSILYKVHPTLMVRATASEGFRAPNNAETGNVQLSAFQNGIQDPKRCAIATQLYNELKKGNAVDVADATRARDAGCSESAAVNITGNPDLKPEKSRTFNAGIVWQPTQDLSMSLDYYHIVRRDEIGNLPVDQILALEDKNPGSVGRLPVTQDDLNMSQRVFELSGKNIVQTTGPISSIAQSYMNLNRTKVAGLDFELNNRINLGSYGKISNTLRANYQLDYRGWDTVEDTYSENLAGNYANYRYNVRASTQWTQGPWHAGATVTYLPGTKLITNKYDDNNSPEGCEAREIPADYCRLKRDVLVNVNGSYTLWTNTTFYANVDNLFNRQPVVDMRAGNPPLRGRTLRVSLEHKF
ncbi:TonB-dependent receptor [Pseudoduganella eburnea]|uniref:TonB-dependent receptor n=1 Tax=Massilia eburnea TaxID=1776165 RepID=A0A6L6QM54_9BURK|nr:TonB-dependent receptor [Massilia eburnea]MTW13498.1 TonB-dependent receptor [Massilia eburnea]